jgi:peptide/nickel transport system permease protein
VLIYAVRRLLFAVPIVLLSTMITFWAVSVSSDPLAQLATCPTCGEGAYQRLIDLYELDKPIPQRYLGWLGDAVTGDLGVATSQGERPVADIFWERFGNTLRLAVPSFVMVAVVALFLSVYSALRQYTVGDYVVTGFSYFGLAMPTFFFGLVLQQFWGIWFPDWTGWKPFYVTGMRTDTWGEYLSSVTLPAITLTLVLVAGESRFGRAAMLEIKNSDYVRTARAKGLSERVVVFKHMLRNAMIPIVTVWALDASALLGGSVVTESIFAWPGLGRMLLDGIFAQDLDMTMAVVSSLAIIAVVFNLLADLLYGVLDPRIRRD